MLTKNRFNEMMNDINDEINALSQNLKTITHQEIYQILGLPKNYNDIINI